MVRSASQRAVPVMGAARRRAAARGAGRRPAAARRPAAPARLGVRVGAVQADGEHQVGLADRLLRPGRELAVGQIQHVVVGALQRVERARRLGAVERRTGAAAPPLAVSARSSTVRCLAANTLDEADRQRPRGSALAPARMRAMVRGRGSGGGARADVGLGDAPRQRHGQRAPDARALCRQRLELGPPQPQHHAVAQRGDGGRARAARQERDLADRLARAPPRPPVCARPSSVTAKRPVTTT